MTGSSLCPARRSQPISPRWWIVSAAIVALTTSVEVPHWDGDQTAIGLGNPADPRFLVYVSVQPAGTAVHLECEVPAGHDASDVPYEVAK
jgi:hypothetical protein